MSLAFNVLSANTGKTPGKGIGKGAAGDAAGAVPAAGGAVGAARGRGGVRPPPAAVEKSRGPDLGESGPANIIPGTRIYSKYRDGTERKAIVIDRRAIKNERGEDTWKYYIHWLDFNRRMDTWVDAAGVRYDTEGDEIAKREARARAEKEQRSRSAAAAGAGGSASAMDLDGGKHGKSGGGAGGGGGKTGAHHGSHGEGGGEQVVDVDGTVLRFHRRAAAAGAGSGAASGSGAGAAGGSGGEGEMVIEFVEPDHEQDGMTEQAIREHEDVTKVKNVNYLDLGSSSMECWYFSPLPKDFWPDGFLDTLHVCEFCLKFFKRKSELLHHAAKCSLKHPPGDEIYRSADGKISFWELDGTKEKFYCQNLCFLAKLFLDHKTLYYDVDPFLFYVLTEADEYGYHVTGYFSKEKFSEVGYNLACILTFPPHQRKGYGRLLIQFSYELSKIERRVGSPERPLSDLGLLSYHSYWSWQLLGIIREQLLRTTPEVSIMELTERTSIKPEDVISTLQQLGLLRKSTEGHLLVAPFETVDKEWTRLNSKPGPVIDAARIHWAPYPVVLHKKDQKDIWTMAAQKAGLTA
jgi:histone acetyltransferase MYST1